MAGEGEETSSNSVRAGPAEAPSLPSTPSEEKDSPSTSSGQTEEKARKPAPTERASDPAIPAGTTMTRLTVREALRDAMDEEMRKDDRIFVMGEEVAEYQGAYKVTQGLLGIGSASGRERVCQSG